MKTRPTWRKSLLLTCLFVLPLFFPTHTRADILWRNTATGQNALWCMNGAAVIIVLALGREIGGKTTEQITRGNVIGTYMSGGKLTLP